MLFTCTAGVLANHVLAALAVADRLPLESLWAVALAHAQTQTLDNLQKNIVWRLLYAMAPLVAVHVQNAPVAMPPALGDLLALGPESEIQLSATEECRYRYLTNTENYHTTKAALGDLPFELLVVIARHGTDGIHNPELAKESGQDARLLRLRLQKLEAAGLIVCRSVYVNKVHTTHSIHTKFVGLSLCAQDYEHVEEDLGSSRDADQLRRAIFDALKVAPNNLRGFSDLKKEFKLDGLVLATKFFRSTCIKLQQAGLIEKLTVELPETKQRVYAVRLVAEKPPDGTPVATTLPEGTSNTFELVSEDEADDEPAFQAPVLNKIFPIYQQIFQQIHETGSQGITASRVTKNLLGVADYKPYVRLFELLPTYLSNSKVLKPFKKYAEPYDDYSVAKLYDNEGKIKFYRYFVTKFCSEEKPKPKAYNYTPKASKDTLMGLNKKLSAGLGKTSVESLIQKKRRAVEATGGPAKRPRPASQPAATDYSEINPDLIKPRLRRAATPRSFKVDEPEDSGSSATLPLDIEEDFVLETFTREVAAQALTSPSPLVQVPPPKPPKRPRKTEAVPKTEASLKALTRQLHLLDIIKEAGGAAVKCTALYRQLDQRLNSSTLTDSKTVSRDVAYLTARNELDVVRVKEEYDGKPLERKVLVLTGAQRPSEEAIAEVWAKFEEQKTRKGMKTFERRLIQSDMTLYNEKLKPLKVPKRVRGKNRLSTLADGIEFHTRGSRTIKSENDSSSDVFSHLKKARRARRVDSSQLRDDLAPAGRRTRRNIKLEKVEATIVYRCVIISRAFSREAMDFDEIAKYVENLDGKLVKQKWGTLRRLFGGASAINKGVETFQNMVMQGVEDGLIKALDLENIDLGFFLKFWKSFDTNIEFQIPDEMPLYATSSKNDAHYTFVDGVLEPPLLLIEKIDDISMRQKESVLSQTLFATVESVEVQAKPHEELRSILKAMFLAKKGTFDPSLVKTFLNPYGDDLVREATDALMLDKEIQYVSIGDDTKFLLSDRFNSSLVRKPFTAAFFHRAAAFKNVLSEISLAGKGLILSQGVHSGEVAALLELISDDLIEMTRIDRVLKFENYESRLIDKEQIACDLIVQCKHEKVQQLGPAMAKVPFIKPCVPIWITLNGSVDKELWTKILITLLAYIVMRPGISDGVLREKMHYVLNNADCEKALVWLMDTKCITWSKTGGYTATDCWQYVLG